MPPQEVGVKQFITWLGFGLCYCWSFQSNSSRHHLQARSWSSLLSSGPQRKLASRHSFEVAQYHSTVAFLTQVTAAHLQLRNTWQEDSQDCVLTQFPSLTSMEKQLATWQEWESLYVKLVMLGFISFLEIGWTEETNLRQSPKLPRSFQFTDFCNTGWPQLLPKRVGEFGKYCKRLLPPPDSGKRQIWQRAAGSQAPGPCFKWSECSERLGRSQSENFTCTQQPSYFPEMWQNINYTLHCRGGMGDQAWSTGKDLT